MENDELMRFAEWLLNKKIARISNTLFYWYIPSKVRHFYTSEQIVKAFREYDRNRHCSTEFNG